MDRYGVVYKGSKNSIAKWVYSHFPVRENFYDLFAGGCAITQRALVMQQFERLFVPKHQEGMIKVWRQGDLFE